MDPIDIVRNMISSGVGFESQFKFSTEFYDLVEKNGINFLSALTNDELRLLVGTEILSTGSRSFLCKTLRISEFVSNDPEKIEIVETAFKKIINELNDFQWYMAIEFYASGNSGFDFDVKAEAGKKLIDILKRENLSLDILVQYLNKGVTFDSKLKKAIVTNVLAQFEASKRDTTNHSRLYLYPFLKENCNQLGSLDPKIAISLAKIFSYELSDVRYIFEMIVNPSIDERVKPQLIGLAKKSIDRRVSSGNEIRKLTHLLDHVPSGLPEDLVTRLNRAINAARTPEPITLNRRIPSHASKHMLKQRV
jgi:uncharacterized protein YaiE (UPF0345 family)